MTELKPCPFCGETPRIFDYKGKHSIECRNDYCGLLVETPYFRSLKDAIEAWNTRADD